MKLSYFFTLIEAFDDVSAIFQWFFSFVEGVNRKALPLRQNGTAAVG